LRLIEAGAVVVVAGEESKKIYRGKHSYPCVTDAAIREIQSTDFDGVILVGGWMPDKLRRSDDVKRLVQEFDRAGKLIAAVCHGGWMAISAGVYRGVRVTGSLGIKDDLIHAGAEWADASVVVDRHHVSSRKPDDLPDFMEAALALLSK
jgi:protease I